MPEPRIRIEGLSLLMTTDEAIASCTRRRWQHTFKPGDGRYSIAAGKPVLPMWAQVENGRIVALEVSYAPCAPARAAAPLAQLQLQRRGNLLGRGWHAAWSLDRRVVIVAQDDGSRVIGVHLGVIADVGEVIAYIATYGRDLAPPERGTS